VRRPSPLRTRPCPARPLRNRGSLRRP
jgi:hypothetical protein